MTRKWREGGDGPDADGEVEDRKPWPGKRSITHDASKTASRWPGKHSVVHELPAVLRTGAGPTGPTMDSVATAAVEHKDAGQAVDPGVLAKVEPHLGADLGGVRVHGDPVARQASAAIGARAFAHGNDVFLGPGESDRDVGLMAHELTHVVQQGAAGEARAQRQVTVGAANSPAEAQADGVAHQVTSGAAPSALLVDAAANGAGQMTKDAFLAALRQQIASVLSGELGPVAGTAVAPYVSQYFGNFGARPAADCEAAVKRYAPATANCHAAADMIPIVVAKLRGSVQSWRDTGTLPTDLPLDVPAATSAMVAPPGSAAAKIAELGPGEALDPAVASRMSAAFGASLDGVTIHTGPEAARATAGAGALAFAVGDHVGFAQGAYRPGSLEGDALLAHELAHVQQQRGGDPRAPLGGESAAAETDADRAALGALQRLAGVKSDDASVLRTGLQLQRCPGGSATPAITDPFTLALQTKLKAGNKAGAFADLVALAGAKAGNGPLRAGIVQFVADGNLTNAEGVRALVIVEIGPDGSGAGGWPTEIRNWVDGITDGVFAVPASGVPAGRDALRTMAITTAGMLANGAGLKGEYQSRFDGQWAVASEPTALDPTLDSKGPRNPRARRIFTGLYADARFKTAYDTNTPPGFREFCDTYAGPTSLNLVASPRLERFRAGLTGAAIVAATTADATYTGFVGTITPLINNLDAGDHAMLEAEPSRWQTLYETKLAGSSPDVVRDFMDKVSGGAVAAPRARSPLSAPPPVVVPPAPAPSGSGTPAPAPGTPPAPNVAEQAFLRSITIAGPSTPVDIEDRSQDVTFDIHSTVPNPSLTVEREVNVSPAAQVMSGTDASREPWPVGVSSKPHVATLDPTTTAATGTTSFTATLDMPPYGAHFPRKTSAPVVVHDKRMDMVRRDVKPGLMFNEFERYVNPTTPKLTYYGGQLTVRVQPNLPVANPGLNLFVSGDIQKGGTPVPGGTFAAAPFRIGTTEFRLAELMLQQPTPPTPGKKDKFELRLRYQIGPSGAPFHSPAAVAFEVAHGAHNTGPTAADTKILTDDTAELAKAGAATAPSGNARTTVREFLRFPPTTLNAQQQANCRRVEAAIASGRVPLRTMFIRSDSEDKVTAAGGDPASQVAYAMGSLAPGDIMIERPGWAGWKFYAGPAIYVNRTPNPLAPTANRSVEEMGMFAAHEAIHSMDDPPAPAPAGGYDAFSRYCTEFRAYWVDGRFDSLSTEYDASFTFGPKSARANALFQHIYSSYDYTKTSYDTDGAFREKVDHYLYPDGTNLIVSLHLDALRNAVRDHTGTFAARHARVSAAYGACTTDDKAQITSQRAWRDDVEKNFSTTAVPVVVGGAPGATEPEVVQIKKLLGISL
jgi:hypothetical protein